MEPIKTTFHERFRVSSARADWHDYNGGAYFVTICTQNREHFFGEIENGEMILSEIGEYVDICTKNIETLHKNIYVPIYQIMPDHIHLIIIMDESVETSYHGVSGKPIDSIETPHCDVSTKGTKNAQMQNIANRCGKLSHVISRFKFVVTRFARTKQPYFVWQTRYFDRIIRDQDEMNRIAAYIGNNVAKRIEGCEVDY